MIRRLSISLMLMALAAFGLGAAAFAWFSDSGAGNVSITSGTVDLKFQIDIDCNGGPNDGYDTELIDADPPVDFDTWQNIVPGDSTMDCIRVLNDGPNGTMDVYVRHGSWTGDNALRNATEWRYSADGAVKCSYAQPNDAKYTADRGCELGTLSPGEDFVLQVDARFPDTGGPQNSLQGLGFGFTSTITGYTG